MGSALPHVYLIRHGETEWAKLGRHTGLKDLPLTEHGQTEARSLQQRLAGYHFDAVWVSSLTRAKETCELAGYMKDARIDGRLVEWNYGDYEGKTLTEILEQRPGWNVFDQGCPGGESVQDVIDRADAVIADLRSQSGHVAIFAHGHFLRLLTARWCGYGADYAKTILLQTTGICRLGYEKTLSYPVVQLWNQRT